MQSQPVLVSVIVVNYNGQSLLPRLFSAVQGQTLHDFELVIVDNASQDSSVDLIRTLCSESSFKTTLLENDANRGFASACNQGLSVARGRWIALLNNDAWPEPDWLERLVETAEQHPEFGMVAAKLLFADLPERIDSAGIGVDRAGMVWDCRGGELDEPDEEEMVEVFGPCGGAGLYARQIFEEIGGFDEGFFAYLEDVDLAWRARLAGWRCVLQPAARVYHIHSATLGESAYKSYLLGRNKIWLIVKNYPAPWLFWFLPLIVTYDLATAIGKSLYTRSLSPLHGRFEAFRGVSAYLHKRRSIQSRWHDSDNWHDAVTPFALPTTVLRRYSHLYWAEPRGRFSQQ